MTIELPELPFDSRDLEPFLSQQAIMLHHGKHHMGHIQRLNQALLGTHFMGMSLHDIVLHSEGVIFFEAAQAWNHNFYWRCLTSDSAEQPDGELLDHIEQYFDSFQNFKSQFEQSALNNLGSGWTWLVKGSNGDLKIINTGNADTPIVDVNTVPLMTVDVWEHAYYIDYRYERAQYLQQLWGFVDWHFVKQNFQRC